MSANDSSSATAVPPRLTDRLLTASLCALCVAVLVHLFAGSAAADSAAAVAYLVFVFAGQRHFRTRERILLGLATALTAAALLLNDGYADLIAHALSRAAFLAAFMVLLALLREGAVTSDAVLGVGRYLTRQPPGRRYAAISTGGHVLGIFLNFGALSLLGPLIQRGLREGADEADRPLLAIREQRQMSALARGFSWIITWSPTAVTQALVPTIVVGADQSRMAATGFGVTLVVLFAGWIEDRWRGAQARRRLAAGGTPAPETSTLPLPRRDVAMFASVCLSLGALTIFVVAVTGVTTIHALMLVAPVVTVGWLWLQLRGHPDTGARVRARIGHILAVSAPRGSPEALTLSVAGYCGIVAAGLTDAETLAAWIRLDGTPPLALYLAAAAIVPIASNLALPPILTVTFLGSLFSALPVAPADPTLLATAFALGWALNLTISPFGATGLVLSRVTGIPATTVTWRWNGLFTLVAYCVVAATLTLLSYA